MTQYQLEIQLQQRALEHIQINAPIYPLQLATALGLSEARASGLIAQLVLLGLLERFWSGRTYVLTHRGIHAAIHGRESISDL